MKKRLALLLVLIFIASVLMGCVATEKNTTEEKRVLDPGILGEWKCGLTGTTWCFYEDGSAVAAGITDFFTYTVQIDADASGKDLVSIISPPMYEGYGSDYIMYEYSFETVTVEKTGEQKNGLVLKMYWKTDCPFAALPSQTVLFKQ